MAPQIKLSRQADGSYRGSYRGDDVAVAKELRDISWVWVARSGARTATASRNGSRAEALDRLQRQLDAAAVDVPPEIDIILQRWAEQVKAIVPGIDPNDGIAAVALERLRETLEGFEQQFRRSAVHIEEDLAKLRRRVQQAPALP